MSGCFTWSDNLLWAGHYRHLKSFPENISLWALPFEVVHSLLFILYCSFSVRSHISTSSLSLYILGDPLLNVGVVLHPRSSTLDIYVYLSLYIYIYICIYNHVFSNSAFNNHTWHCSQLSTKGHFQGCIFNPFTEDNTIKCSWIFKHKQASLSLFM